MEKEVNESTKQLALNFLNEVAPDTFNEGEFYNWTFTDLRFEDDFYILTFSNSAVTDYILEFKSEFPVITPEDGINMDWMKDLNAAIFAEEDFF